MVHRQSSHGVPHTLAPSAFTLIELLIVIGIIGVLIALIAPSLEKARERGRLAACGENLHQIGIGLNVYAGEFNNYLPLGSSSLSPLGRAWSSLGSNQVWIGADQQYTGLGLLTSSFLKDPRMLACPSDNDPSARTTLTAGLGKTTSDLYGSYTFRQFDQTNSARISTPGTNSLGNPARAIVFDWQSSGPAPYQRNSHDFNEYLNILYIDGHVQGFEQEGDLATTVDTFAAMPNSYLHALDQLWVTADYAETGASRSAPKLP